MSETDLVMYRGDDRSFTLTLTSDGEPIDLTGSTLRFTAKRRLADLDADAIISLTSADGISVLDEENGVIRVDIPASATVDLTTKTRLHWDVQITDDGGKVQTAPSPDLRRSTLGTLTVVLDVSQAVP